MKTKYILKIENPCQESWNAMSKNDGGKHCESCNKNVVDFSQLNDSEIIKYLSKNNSSKICGRLETHQLSRIIKADINHKPKFNKLIAALFLFGAAKSAVAQTQTQPSQHQTINSKSKNENLKNTANQQINEQDSLTKVIEGIVIAEEDKLAIPGVHVKIKGSNAGAVTDAKGKFKLFIPENLQGKKIELDFGYIGYKQLLVQIKPSDLKGQKEFRMCTEATLMGEVVIVSAKKKWWKFWKW